jgi:hypothetical protein
LARGGPVPIRGWHAATQYAKQPKQPRAEREQARE